MKLISWNVNGLRACLTHGFADSFAALDADIFSVQETKMQPGQADFAPEGYTEYTYSAFRCCQMMKFYLLCLQRKSRSLFPMVLPLRNMTTKAGCSRWNTRAFIW